MPESVRITDVAPRDGLQNERLPVRTADKARLVQMLCAARVDEVEVTSFVSPKWVPQLGDAAEVFAALAAQKPAEVCFSALVPNEKGLAGALEVNARSAARLIDKVSVFTAASESFALRNTNATIAETIARFRPVVHTAHAAGLLVRGYVSWGIACPFEGPIAPAAVARVAVQLAELGIDEIDLGDTIGAGTRETTCAMLHSVSRSLGGDWTARLTWHPHDTSGRAADTVLGALSCGVRSFDGAAGGLGGCPYASVSGRRAPGNIATENLVDVVTAAGFATRVDAANLRVAGEFARTLRSPS